MFGIFIDSRPRSYNNTIFPLSTPPLRGIYISPRPFLYIHIYRVRVRFVRGAKTSPPPTLLLLLLLREGTIANFWR